MATNSAQLDVLVVGNHPSAFLAAIALKETASLRVAHCSLPGKTDPDRLVIVNPELFKLHRSIAGLGKKLDARSIYGLSFVGEEPTDTSEHRAKSAMAIIASSQRIAREMSKLALAKKVQLLSPRTFEVRQVDERAVELGLGKNVLRTRSLLVAGELPESSAKVLGASTGWPVGVVHRYTYLKLPKSRWIQAGNRPVIPMSLNLAKSLCWGWLLPGSEEIQLAVEQPIESLSKILANDLMRQWGELLMSRGWLSAQGGLPLKSLRSIDLPLAGALEAEGVASRSLLFGPAGGFYSACAEETYPACWSATFAVEAIKKALRELHLQDALVPVAQKWRTSLGEYLRGPQQDLRFLLPLVYRNQKMTTRLAESILQGKKVVR